MKLRLLLPVFLVFLLSSSFVSAGFWDWLTGQTTYAPYDFSQYPSPFAIPGEIPAVLVIGDTAPASDTLAGADITQSLLYFNIRQGVRSLLASEYLRDSGQYSYTISIGNPCNNRWTQKLSGQTSCTFGLMPGQALLRMVPPSDSSPWWHLLVVGYAPEDTRRAATVLSQYADRRASFKGTEMCVTGTASSPIITPGPCLSSTGSVCGNGKCETGEATNCSSGTCIPGTCLKDCGGDIIKVLSPNGGEAFIYDRGGFDIKYEFSFGVKQVGVSLLKGGNVVYR